MTQINNTKGFTLIEMIAVVAIIGILSSVVMVNLSGARLRARDTERVTEIAQLVLGLENFYNSCRTYPTGLASGDTGGGACPGTVTLGSFIDPPQDPTNGNYKYDTDGNTYVVGADFETDHEALSEDVDTDMFTVSCDQPREYCKSG